MKRYKRIGILFGVLLVACGITFAVSRYEEQKELIQNSDEIILELPSDSIQSISWDYDSQSLAFHRDDTWLYDEDETFPVDEEKIDQLLAPFQSFGVSFIIEDVEDYGQYGLDDPVCTIQLETEDETYEIQLGDYSTMDEERYVSIGDGNVYLVSTDPLDTFSVELSDLIDQDDIPSFDLVNDIQFSGAEDSQITYELGSTDTYREEDVYFLQQEDAQLPLDSTKVEDYLQTIQSLDLTNYVTYNAGEEDLQTYGLDDPELTVRVDYTWEDEENQDHSETFTLSISRAPEERAAAESDTEDEEAEEITTYARVGDSQIIYQITGTEYEALMDCSYNALRHTEILPANFQDIRQVDITLEGETYTITSGGEDEDKTYYYQDQELEIDTFQTALEALSAEQFTGEQPTEKEEISLTVQLDLDGDPSVQIDLYRYDGDYCLAVVDGEPLALVLRDSVVDLVESVNEIVLNA